LAPAQIAAFSIASFLAGVAAAGGNIPPVFVLAAAALCGSIVLALRRGRLAAFFIPAACLAGILYYHLYFSVRAARTTIPFDVQTSFAGIVAAEPGHSAKSEYFPLRLTPPHHGQIRVVVPPGSGFKYGDALKLQGTMLHPEKERDLPVAIFPKTELIASGRGSPVRQALLGFKYVLLDVFPRYLPSTEAAFLGGITLGARFSFSPEFTTALAASGTTHLVALSGYNIAILVLVIFGGCLRLFGRRAAFYLTTLSLLVFVAMVGAEPSVVRAAAMGFVVLLARELGRPYGLPFALLWTAFFMVLYNPGALFMPGFQLSFMSLLGIVYLSPVILRWLGAAGHPDVVAVPAFLGSFRENAALTISAQLAVAPIALVNFGGVSLSSFLANALILPFMPMTMFFGFALLLCGLIFPPLGILAGMVSHIFLSYEIAVIHFFAVLSLPVTVTLGGFGIALYYLLLFILVRRYQLKEDEG